MNIYKEVDKCCEAIQLNIKMSDAELLEEAISSLSTIQDSLHTEGLNNTSTVANLLITVGFICRYHKIGYSALEQGVVRTRESIEDLSSTPDILKRCVEENMRRMEERRTPTRIDKAPVKDPSFGANYRQQEFPFMHAQTGVNNEEKRN